MFTQNGPHLLVTFDLMNGSSTHYSQMDELLMTVNGKNTINTVDGVKRTPNTTYVVPGGRSPDALYQYLRVGAGSRGIPLGSLIVVEYLRGAA